ncbi:hypothetical protein [Priestia megaterium]|uniref:hypothetical protein n=1 Tax=Priestia megaterium TaxID=1404 RepID=UPI0022B86EE6|nr:hypothetical protein [Priestia megaterium]MCZ8493599.1 hypothetical protein [Priestia megaterium]
MEFINYVKEKSVRMQLFYSLCIYVVAGAIRMTFIAIGYQDIGSVLIIPVVASGVLFANFFVRFWIDSINDSKKAEAKAIKTKEYLNEQGITYTIGFDFKRSRMKLRLVYSACLLANILSIVANTAIAIAAIN